MAEMVGLAEIASRLNLDNRSVRRLIARESETLEIEIHRGKGDKVLLSKDDAERLMASYLARRGPQASNPEENANDLRRLCVAIQTVSRWPIVLPSRLA